MPIGVGTAILGSAALGFLGSRGGGSQTTSSAPWSGQQSYLKRLFGDANLLLNQGPQQYFPGSTVAGFDPYQQQALGMQANRAMQGSPLVRGAQQQALGTIGGGYLGRDPSSQYLGGIAGGQNINPALGLTAQTAGGGYLGGSPYLDEQFNRATQGVSRRFQETIAPSIAGNAVLGGRYGSPAYQRQQEGAQRALGETLGNVATDIYGGSYARERGLQEAAQGRLGGLYQGGIGQQISAAGQIGGQYGAERGRQMQALGLAPGLAGQDYADISKLFGAGQAYQGQAQLGIDAARQRFDFGQNAQFQNLQRFQSLVGGGGYGGSTTQQFSSNPLAGAAGGALAGLGMYGSFGSPSSGGQQPLWNPSYNPNKPFIPQY